MIILILCILLIIVILSEARYQSVKKSIQSANKELQEITDYLSENRILKLQEPNKDLEELLITMNQTLELIRKEKIMYMQREKEYQNQIECISHDLRTPLTSIIGYLKIMDREALSAEDQESYQIISRKAASLQHLISQFYDISRLTGNDYPFAMETVDVGRILRESVIDQYYELEERGLEVSLKLPEKPVYISGDENALERIFSNFLINACRYAISSLRVSLVSCDNVVEIRFENDTKDISQDNVDQLFERFYMGENARGEGSTGLGLTISKQLIEKMEGQLTAEVFYQKMRTWLRFQMQFPFL